jgi:hypothetical protein
VYFGDSLAYWKNILPPSSGSESKPSKKLAEAGSKVLNYKLHRITTEILLSTVTATKTSNPVF